MKKLIIVLLTLIAVGFQNCKKEKENFTYCTGCPIFSWVGYYSGTGTYFTANTGETVDNIEVNINIENTYDSNLVIHVEAPNYISESFSKSKTDDKYYILIGSGARTLDLGLKRSGNQYRLNGTLKKNSWNKVDSTWTVVQSLTFQVDKKSP